MSNPQTTMEPVHLRPDQAHTPQPADNTKPVEQAPVHKSATSVKKPPAPVKKTTNSGVATAIVATVIIVLGLAALATYAYIKTKP